MFVYFELFDRLLVSMVGAIYGTSFFGYLLNTLPANRMLTGKSIRLSMMWMKPLLALITLELFEIVEIHRLTTIINFVDQK